MAMEKELALRKNLEEIANSELSLLLLCQLLEGNKDAHIFSIPEITKEQLNRFPEAIREFHDTNEHSSPYHLAVYKIQEILNDLDLGEIQSYIIWDPEKAIEDFFQIIRATPIESYGPLLDNLKKANEQLVALCIEGRKAKESILRDDPENIAASLDPSIEITADRFESEFDEVLHLVPEHIGINVSLNKNQAQKIRDILSEYIRDFAEDKYYWTYGVHQKRRKHFLQQLDSFYQYLSSRSTINGSYNIPFSSIQNEDFEIIKILKFLELAGKIIMYWTEKSGWKIELSTPIRSSQDLLPESMSRRVQIFLDFSEPESTLSYGDQKLNISGKDQRFLLKTLFENQNERLKMWEFSEICERFDPTEVPPEKKFYNAARQIMRRFKEKFNIEKVLITKTHTVRINPEYLKKS